jgi:quinoprotein glucose dehydrogenase
LTAYDLNKGTIKWQIGLGDDLRLMSAGVKGTGAAQTLKGSVIPTATGLVFVNAADRKVHVYDSETGKEISQISLGATTSGSPSMYELNGKQYLLVTASDAGGRGGPPPANSNIPPASGPTGLVAYALR